jgi:hypothetical protein
MVRMVTKVGVYLNYYTIKQPFLQEFLTCFSKKSSVVMLMKQPPGEAATLFAPIGANKVRPERALSRLWRERRLRLRCGFIFYHHASRAVYSAPHPVLLRFRVYHAVFYLYISQPALLTCSP